MSFISIREIAEITDVSPQSIRKAISQGSWLGSPLDVREVSVQGGRGGVGYEINIDSLPEKYKEIVLSKLNQSEKNAKIAVLPQKNSKKLKEIALELQEPQIKSSKPSYSPASLWATWEVAKTAAREKAEYRLKIIKEINSLVALGMAKVDAIAQAAPDVTYVSVYGWYKQIKDIGVADWLPALLPNNKGRLPLTDSYQPVIYQAFKDYYLTTAKRSFSHCYQLTSVDAGRYGWGEMPSLYLLKSRLENELAQQLKDYGRQGKKAKSFLNPIPPQVRDKSGMVALEWINGDGYDHEFYVIFPDGKEGKPVTWFWQDVYSGMLLSYYSDVSENSDMLRLALRETIKQYGLGVNNKPFNITVDNTRAASARVLTGRAVYRHRYKLRDDEAKGVFGRLGTEYHPTLPFSGQSKPIERKFGIGGISELVDRDPLVEDARNAGKAISWEAFQALLKKAVNVINNRVSRSKVCNGKRTPLQVFNMSIEQNIVLKASNAQLNMLMMCAVGVPVNKTNGSVAFLDNVYWVEELARYCGERVMIEYDPQNLHDGVNVYTLDNQFIAHAPCIHAVGWADTDAARETAKLKRRHQKAIKEAFKAEVAIGAKERAKRNLKAELEEIPGVGSVDKRTGEIVDYKPVVTKVVGVDFKKPAKPQGMTEEQEAMYAKRMAEQRAKLRKAI
ncbi:transposase domain-containing protein [Beggiatoa leptomitoformis]|uniref:DDE-type integrase/transposase/recombinase n=1 Tax=Beggiatoa leptomitoformis TaxID=288004 RepID=A0A2N9YH93_9GAMM|nr:transposase domain-containing protein [Beggiatoa leptomitoformis]ALG67901.1 hypothetical protein AL038_09490 [Beggiatoa leptomitoformis]AUI69833.1 hypothetical protein BLE401_14790 [Beggiatoa leptomitoformis]